MRVSRKAVFMLVGAVALAGISVVETRLYAAGADENTILLLHGDGKDGGTQIIDDSRNDYSITVTGQTSTQKEESKFGFSSIYFDGSVDYLTHSEATAYDFAGDFTIDLWVRVDTLSGGWGGPGGGGGGTREDLVSAINGAWVFYIQYGTTTFSGGTISLVCDTVVDMTTWTHLAVVRSGSTATMYHNGTSCATDASASGSFNATGVYVGVYSSYFNGYMDEIRISNVARWTSNFTPPTQAYEGSIRFNSPVLVTGDASVNGTISKGAGTFAIDHPLDPANLLLYHSFVESPDVKNLYDGIVTLDENGEAEITLPYYFLALNRDFRYFASPLDQPMPDLHMKKPIGRSFFGADISFRVSGGVPGGTISWQVSGNRRDPFIMQNPIKVEVPKGSHTIVPQGECLHEPLCD